MCFRRPSRSRAPQRPKSDTEQAHLEPKRSLDAEYDSIRTERSYAQYIYFHDKKHPKDMGVPEIRDFLIHIASEGNLAASTQNVARSALLNFWDMRIFEPLWSIPMC
ncbi:MAG: hypothetical protein HC921_18745 [Synechococcaceae cyanobacterium SM2_3_1]|nr:hypothetical protein [Synechococcaceae cyanobacterium SM2_3_1]